MFVFPVEVNYGILISFSVSGDGAVFFKSGKEMFGVAFLHILNAKIIYYE